MDYSEYKKTLMLIISIVIPLVFVTSLANKRSAEREVNSGISDETKVNYNKEDVYKSDDIHETYGDYGEDADENLTEEDLKVNHPQLKKGYKEVEPSIKPTSFSENGSVVIHKNNAIEINKKSRAVITIEFLFDPVCPASSAYNTMLQDELKKELDSGEIELIYRVVPYLNRKTIGDYSNRASSYILATAEYAPNYAQSFINSILSRNFQPSSPASKYTSDDLFKDELKKIGVSSEVISKIEMNKDSYVPIVVASSKDFEDKKSKWTKLSMWEDNNGEPIIYTPFVVVNKKGSFENNALKVHSVDPRKELRSRVDKELK